MRVISRHNGDRGDTLIEVIFAFAVFALVAVSTIVIMNQGIATAQRTLEITQVRQQIDAQATILRYVHEAHVADVSHGTTTSTTWGDMLNLKKSAASDFGSTLAAGFRCPAMPANAFVLNPASQELSTNITAINASAPTPPPYAQVQYTATSAKSYGLWVEAIPHDVSPLPGGKVDDIGYVDFHIRACWDSVGSQAPVTLGTIVRLYEPAF